MAELWISARFPIINYEGFKFMLYKRKIQPLIAMEMALNDQKWKLLKDYAKIRVFIIIEL